MMNSNGSANFRTGIVYVNSIKVDEAFSSLFRYIAQGISHSTREHDKPLIPSCASVDKNAWSHHLITRTVHFPRDSKSCWNL